jgi:hypothetical protein
MVCGWLTAPVPVCQPLSPHLQLLLLVQLSLPGMAAATARPAKISVPCSCTAHVNHRTGRFRGEKGPRNGAVPDRPVSKCNKKLVMLPALRFPAVLAPSYKFDDFLCKNGLGMGELEKREPLSIKEKRERRNGWE